MKQKRKTINLFVVVLVAMLIGIVMITMKKTNSEIATTSKETKKATTSSTFSAKTDNSENSSEMTWGISENGDGSVIATLTEDGTLTIAGQGKMQDIGSNDWDGKNKEIKAVIIKDGITNIPGFLFRKCSNMNSITIPTTVEDISDSAFDYISSLTKINVDSNNEKFMSEDGILFNKDKTELIRYPEGKTDIEYEIPTSVTRINMQAFEGCKRLENIIIPNGVTSIGKTGNFSYGCTGLTNITIPASVTNIEDIAFGGCTSLTKINVDPNNEKFMSEDGILFNKDKTELIRYPAGKTDIEYEIPTSVTSIAYGAFEDCRRLENIIIPNGVTGAWTFKRCTRLKNIMIPASVDKILDSIFYGCTSLKEINVDPNNEKFMSEDGILFNKDKTELICYPAGKTDTVYRIPSTVTKIADDAFACCAKLTNITIPKSVTTIGNVTFNFCSSDLVIQGEAGSYAETYANEHNKKFEISVNKIAIAPQTATIKVGGTQALIVAVEPENATNKEVEWSSSNESIATITSAGIVTGRKEGKVTITATLKSDSSKTATATVTIEAKSTTLPDDNQKPSIGEVENITKDGKQYVYITITDSEAEMKDIEVTIGNEKCKVEKDEDGRYYFIPEKNGTYTIKVTNSNGSIDTKQYEYKKEDNKEENKNPVSNKDEDKSNTNKNNTDKTDKEPTTERKVNVKGEDGTKATISIPKAGILGITIRVLIGVSLIGLIITGIKVKRYKDI